MQWPVHAAMTACMAGHRREQCRSGLERSRPEKRCVLHLLILELIAGAQGCRTPREQDFWESSCEPLPAVECTPAPSQTFGVEGKNGRLSKH